MRSDGNIGPVFRVRLSSFRYLGVFPSRAKSLRVTTLAGVCQTRQMRASTPPRSLPALRTEGREVRRTRPKETVFGWPLFRTEVPRCGHSPRPASVIEKGAFPLLSTVQCAHTVLTRGM